MTSTTPEKYRFKKLTDIIFSWIIAALIFVLKRIPAWLIGVFITVIIGIFIQTQNVISRLGHIGADIGLGDRLSMIFYDIQHLSPLYGAFIAIAFLVAFCASGLLYRITKFGRPLIYTIAGAIAILVMLFAMKKVFFDIHMIAGARDGVGIGLQMLAGAIGGWVFAHLTRHLIKTKPA